jgi:hypothetical protein
VDQAVVEVAVRGGARGAVLTLFNSPGGVMRGGNAAGVGVLDAVTDLEYERADGEQEEAGMGELVPDTGPGEDAGGAVEILSPIETKQTYES